MATSSTCTFCKPFIWGVWNKKITIQEQVTHNHNQYLRMTGIRHTPLAGLHHTPLAAYSRTLLVWAMNHQHSLSFSPHWSWASRCAPWPSAPSPPPLVRAWPHHRTCSAWGPYLATVCHWCCWTGRPAHGAGCLPHEGFLGKNTNEFLEHAGQLSLVCLRHMKQSCEMHCASWCCHGSIVPWVWQGPTSWHITQLKHQGSWKTPICVHPCTRT